MPTPSRTKIAKLATLFAAILLVSLGLCGANFALFLHFGDVAGGPAPSDRPAWASTTLMGAGFVELLGIAVGGAGLLITAVIGIVRAFLETLKDPQ